MSTPREHEILLRAGGAEVLRTGRAWNRRRWDRDEGDAPTFTRADSTTCRTYLDRDLALRTAAAAKLRGDWTGSVLSLLFGNADANLCLQSENFGTTWSSIGTPTRVAGNATSGALSLDLIGDDAAGTAEGYRQTGLSFTGDAVKSVSVFVKQGSSTSTVFLLDDTTAVATRLLAVLTWSGGVPSVAMTTGTYLGYVALGSGVYRLLFQTASITAANAHRIDVYPATSGAFAVANTGTINVGGVHVSNARYPRSYIKTTTATVTGAADHALLPIGFMEANLTAYLSIVRPPWADCSGDIGLAPYLLDIGTGPYLNIYGAQASRFFTASAYDGSSTQAVNQAIPAGATIDLCVQWADLTTAGKVRLDVGSGFGSYSSTVAAISRLTGNQLALGDGVASPGNCLDSGVIKLLLCRGLFTLAECQAVPWTL